MFQRTKIGAAAAMVVGGLALGWTTAHAQAERVEITGSSIKRVQGEGALPVQTLSQKEIQRSGATSVTDLLQKLPVMQGFTSVVDTVGGSGAGLTTASIHDLGEQYTLVLLNGRRVAPATSGTTIDLNSIPLSAVERVEILTDGASAVYGADAIAGVVNFILKNGAAPLTIEARTSWTHGGGGSQSNFAVSKGFGDLAADGYSFFVSGSYDNQRQLRGAQREFAKTGILSGKKGNLNYDFFNGSSRSVPPNVDVYDLDLADPIIAAFSPYYMANGTCPKDHVVGGAQCVFDYTTTVEVQPEIERKSIFGSGKVALGQTGLNGFFDVALTDVSTIARIAPYPAEFAMDKTHPYFNTYVAPYLTAQQIADTDLVNVKYRLYDMGNRTYDYNTKSLHTVLGVEGNTMGWDLNTGVTFSKQKQEQNYLKGFPLADKFNAALNAQQFDPFPYTLGTMPADQLAVLNSTQYIGNYNTTDIKMVSWDGHASRPVFKMAGGDAMLSVGAEVRSTGYKQTPNSAVANAEILFDDPQPSFDLSRRNWGAFTEMLFPVTKAIELNAALRYDDYSGVKDSITGTTAGSGQNAATFKLGGKWQIVPSLLARASYGTGFRVAEMKEIAQPKTDFGVTSGTYNCPFDATHDPLGYVAAGYTCLDDQQYEVFQGGNPDLKPEKSKQWNVGGVWQATDAFSVGLNYWSVEVKDGVSSVSEQLILDNPDKYLDLYTTKFKASNGLTYVAIMDQPINIGRIQNQGIDWDFTYKGRFEFGQMQGRLAGTHLVKSRYTVPGTDDQWTSSLNKFGVDDKVAFKNIVAATGTLILGGWEHTATLNYRNGYTDQVYTAADDCVFYDPSVVPSAADDGCRTDALDVPSYTTFDWRSQWKMTKNLTLALGIVNVFDRDPPRSLRVNGAGHQLGYDPRYASAYGRTYSLEGKLEF